MAQYETKAAFARRMNTSPREVSKQIHRGLPETPKGYIPIRKGQAWWEANFRSRVDSNVGPDASLPVRMFAASRAKKMAHDAEKSEADAKRAQLELKIAQGEFIATAEVDRTWFEILRITRARLQAIPDRIASRLAADLGVEQAARKVRLVLGQEIRTALEALNADLSYKRDGTAHKKTSR